MFAGYFRFADGTVEPLTAARALIELARRDEGLIWVDILEPAEEEIRAIDDAFHLDGEALLDCMYGEQRPRIDEFEDYIFLVLYGAPSLEGSEAGPPKLAVFCSNRYLITIHHEPLQPISQLLERCSRHPTQTMGRGLDFILYSMIDTIVDSYVLAAEQHESMIEELEDASLDPSLDEAILGGVSRQRRSLVDLRQLAVSQRDLLLPMARGEYDYISESLEQRFSHVCDHLAQVIDLVDSLRDRLQGVRDNYNASLANRTNEVMKVLTLFAAVLLPMSVIAGVYGMNVPLWPQQDHPLSFWFVLVLMFVIGGGMLWYFRRRRWL